MRPSAYPVIAATLVTIALAGCSSSSTPKPSPADDALAQKYTHNMVESALQGQLRQDTGKTFNDVTCDSPVTRVTHCHVGYQGKSVPYTVTFSADNDHFNAQQG